MPYPDVYKSLRCLDYRRLGKQRVEAFQIINIITGKTDKKGWVNHPAVRMWRGHEQALMLYFDAAVDIWVERGYKNNMRKYWISAALFPDWFGDEAFHRSHQSNLIRKDPAFYGPQFPGIPSDLPYVWPI